MTDQHQQVDGGIEGPVRVLTAAAFLTGFAALSYQVVWQRMLGLFTGSDVRATTIITSAFLAGLGIGSLLGSRWADRLTSRAAVRAFAACNVGIAAFAAMSRLLFYDVLFIDLDGLAERSAIAFAVVFAGLLVPTALMGLSLPLVAKAIVRSVDHAARRIGVLYGLNTLGAAAGTIITGWVVIGAIGYEQTAYVGASLSAIAAGLALLVSAGFDRNDGNPQVAARAALRGVPATVWHWSALVFASGFVAISLELIWFRILDVTLRSNAYTFAHVLAFFLFGDAIGNVLGARMLRWIANPRRAFLIIQAVVAAYAMVSVRLLGLAAGRAPLSTYIDEGAGDVSLTAGAGGLELFVYVVVPAFLMIVPAVLIGLTFPIAQQAVQTEAATVGQRVGLVDMFNIAGNAAGGIVTGTALFHFLGAAAALRLVGIAALGFVALLAYVDRSAGARLRIGAVAIAIGLVAAIVLAPTQRTLWSSLHGATDGDRFLVAEDSSGVSAVRVEGSTATLYADGRLQGSLPYLDVHVMLGALPALVHPEPREVLVIGIGSTGTASAAGLRPVTDRIVAFEIHDSQQEVMRELAATGTAPELDRFFGDPRYELHIADGRREMRFTDERFDVIEADAIRPHASRSGLLYSREFFEEARSKLAPGGIMAQWNATERVEATFTAVFPHVVLVPPVLLGSNEPIAFDPEQVASRLGERTIADYLTTIGADVEVLRERISAPVEVWTDVTARRAGSTEINTDLFPRDEYYLNN